MSGVGWVTHLAMDHIHALVRSSLADLRMAMPYDQEVVQYISFTSSLSKCFEKGLTKVSDRNPTRKVQHFPPAFHRHIRPLALLEHILDDTSETFRDMLLAEVDE